MAQKLKTHKGVQKRFKLTKGKKVLAAKACNNHLLTNKGKSNKKSPYGKQMDSAYSKTILNLLPYKS